MKISNISDLIKAIRFKKNYEPKGMDSIFGENDFGGDNKPIGGQVKQFNNNPHDQRRFDDIKKRWVDADEEETQQPQPKQQQLTATPKPKRTKNYLDGYVDNIFEQRQEEKKQEVKPETKTEVKPADNKKQKLDDWMDSLFGSDKAEEKPKKITQEANRKKDDSEEIAKNIEEKEKNNKQNEVLLNPYSDKIQETVKQYGWTSSQIDEKTIIIKNRKDREVSKIVFKGSKFRIEDMSGNKLMTGNASIESALKKLLEQYYYAEKLPQQDTTKHNEQSNPETETAEEEKQDKEKNKKRILKNLENYHFANWIYSDLEKFLPDEAEEFLLKMDTEDKDVQKKVTAEYNKKVNEARYLAEKKAEEKAEEKKDDEVNEIMSSHVDDESEKKNGKFPWQMTLNEFIENKPKIKDFVWVYDKYKVAKIDLERTGSSPNFGTPGQSSGYKYGGILFEYPRIHRFVIERAIKSGKEVPDDVLKEYPDLKEASDKNKIADNPSNGAQADAQKNNETEIDEDYKKYLSPVTYIDKVEYGDDVLYTSPITKEERTYSYRGDSNGEAFIYDKKTGSSFKVNKNELKNANKKIDTNFGDPESIKYAYKNGSYDEWIEQGLTTKEKVKEILESAGISTNKKEEEKPLTEGQKLFKEKMDKLNQDKQEREKSFEDTKEDTIVMEDKNGYKGVISPSAREGGKWQLSEFNKDEEPHGHKTYSTKEEAIKDAITIGYSALHVGDTKTENGHTYRLNNNHRWERVDEDVKEENKKDSEETYKYYLTQRPPSIGTHPEGAKDIKEVTLNGRKAWEITYNKPLSKEDIENYELKKDMSEHKGKKFNLMGTTLEVKDADVKGITLTGKDDSGDTVDLDYSPKEFTDMLNSGEIKEINEEAGETKQPEETKGIEKQKQDTDTNKGYNHYIGFIKNMYSNGTTAKEVLDKFNELTANKETIIEELSKLKKDELLNLLPYSGMQYRNDKKESIIKQVYDSLLHKFHFSNSYSANPFDRKSFEEIMRGYIERQTDEDINKYLEKIKKSSEEWEKEREEKAESMKNPKTLEDFRNKVRQFGLSSLTLEENVKYDELVSLDIKERIKSRDKKQTAQTPNLENDKYELKETKHTKTGEKLYVVSLKERVSKEDYYNLNSTAKRLGGYYSSYNREGAIPGFQFKDKAQADKFISSIQGEKIVESAQDNKITNRAEKLRNTANRIIEAATENKDKDRLSNTSRRARIAANIRERENKNIALGETMLRIADALEKGEIKFIDGVKSKSDCEILQSILDYARYNYLMQKYGSYSEYEKHENAPFTDDMVNNANMFPEIEINDKWWLDNILEKIKDKPGYKQLYKEWNKKLLANKKLGKEIYRIKNFNEFEEYEKIIDASGIQLSPDGTTMRGIKKAKIFKAMGIETNTQLRTALREYAKYMQEPKEDDKIKKLEMSIIGRGKSVGIDFFPTPKHVAKEMVNYADIKEGMKVLEPSAGNGNIADAISETGVIPDVAEISGELRQILEAKGYNIVANDFMSINNKNYYDRIIMNPPFSNGLDIEHIRHAHDLVKPGGVIIAIAGEGSFIRNDKKSKEFREWLDDLGADIQQLEKDTFMDKTLLNTTGANARLIVIHKDDDTTKSIKLFGKLLSFDKKTDSLKDKFFSLFKSKQFPLQGRLSFQGMDIAIENRKGSVRKGTDEDGEKWKTKMFYPYGYIRGTMGVDGDAVDCYIGDNRDSTKVFIVHQKNPFTGKFDEDKVMLGFDTKNQARDAYLAHYDSYEFLGEITEMDINEFKNKVYLTKKQPKIIKSVKIFNKHFYLTK